MAVIELTPARIGIQTQAGPRARGGVELGRVSAADPVGEAIGQLGQTLNAVAQAKAQAEDQSQMHRARAESLRVMAEAEARSNGDVQAYRQATAEGFRRVAETLPGHLRGGYLDGIGPEAAAVEFRIQRAGAMRAQGEANAAREENLAEVANRGVFGSPAEREAMRQRGVQIIQESIAAGTMSAAQARTRLQRWNAEYSEGVARRLMRDNPAEARALLSDPQQLPGLTPVQRFRLLDRAVREGRRAGGGLRRGGGADVSAVPDLDATQVAALQAEGEHIAEAEDEQELMQFGADERRAFTSARVMADDAADQFFAAAAGRDDADAGRLTETADLAPLPVIEAARAVSGGRAAMRDDDGALAVLLPAVHEMEPEAFRAEASRAVAAGQITPDGWLRLVTANRDARADTPAARAWRQVRGETAAQLTAPDLGDLAPMAPDMAEGRTRALAELDEWRAANPRASALEARTEAAAIATRHREAMVTALARSLPPPDGFMAGAGPYAPAALEEAEIDVLTALERGDVPEAEAARRLRLLEAWRWVAGDETP